MNGLKRHCLQGLRDNSCFITYQQAQWKAQDVLSFTFSSPEEEAGEVRKTRFKLFVFQYLECLYLAAVVRGVIGIQRLPASDSCKSEVLRKKNTEGGHHNACLCLGKVTCGATVTDGPVKIETRACGDSGVFQLD